MPKTERLDTGVYLINGTSDADGNRYQVAQRTYGAGTGEWIVFDSRGRVVSTHPTKADAIGSMVEKGE